MSNNPQHTADSKSILPSEAAQQRARVLMSIDPKIFALQQKNGFADGIILGNEVTLSGVVTEFGNGETDLETAYIRTLKPLVKSWSVPALTGTKSSKFTHSIQI
jgi:hypothetical protein